MKFMNTSDIDEVVERFQNHPTLGPAARVLAALRDLVDMHSDGWCHWTRPVQAAKQLIELLEKHRYDYRAEVCASAVKKTFGPIKAFVTRHKDLLRTATLPGLASEEAKLNKLLEQAASR